MGTPLRALIVEDVEQDALLVVLELKRGGFDVTSERVDTPEAMSEALAAQPWDVIISGSSAESVGGLSFSGAACGKRLPWPSSR